VDDEMKKSFLVLGLILFLSLLSSISIIPINATAYHLFAIADSYVQLEYPNTNFGHSFDHEVLISAEAFPASHSYGLFKFDISSIDGAPASALFYTHARRETGATLYLYEVTDDSWTETGVTWNNQPAISSLIQEQLVDPYDYWVEWNITDYAITEYGGDKIVSLEFRAVYTDHQLVVFDDREYTSFAPYLVIETGSLTYHTITASCGSDGTISPSGAIQVIDGGSQTFIAEGDFGYKPESLIIDGNPVAFTIVSRIDPAPPYHQLYYVSYTFSGVIADHTIYADFNLFHCHIDASAGSNGQIAPHGTISVGTGMDMTFYFYPDEGYNASELWVDGLRTFPVGTSITFYNVAANHTVHVDFSPSAEGPLGVLDEYIMLGLMMIIGLGAVGFAIGGGKDPMPAMFMMLFGCALCYYAGLFPWWIFVLSVVTLALLSAWRFSSIFKGGG
jgi:hypothetical protein